MSRLEGFLECWSIEVSAITSFLLLWTLSVLFPGTWPPLHNLELHHGLPSCSHIYSPRRQLDLPTGLSYNTSSSIPIPQPLFQREELLSPPPEPSSLVNSIAAIFDPCLFWSICHHIRVTLPPTYFLNPKWLASELPSHVTAGPSLSRPSFPLVYFREDGDFHICFWVCPPCCRFLLYCLTPNMALVSTWVLCSLSAWVPRTCASKLAQRSLITHFPSQAHTLFTIAFPRALVTQAWLLLKILE